MSGEAVSVEPTALRTVMARFATGVTVVTTAGTDPHGMTANAVCSVSLEPAAVLCCVARTSRLDAAVRSAGTFAVSILGSEQGPVARWFANRARPEGWAQFGDDGWRAGPHTGAPLLDGALAWLECTVSAEHDGGDHAIFLGTVVGCGVGDDTSPLLFVGGRFHELGGAERPIRPAQEAS